MTVYAGKHSFGVGPWLYHKRMSALACYSRLGQWLRLFVARSSTTSVSAIIFILIIIIIKQPVMEAVIGKVTTVSCG